MTSEANSPGDLHDLLRTLKNLGKQTEMTKQVNTLQSKLRDNETERTQEYDTRGNSLKDSTVAGTLSHLAGALWIALNHIKKLDQRVATIEGERRVFDDAHNSFMFTVMGHIPAVREQMERDIRIVSKTPEDAERNLAKLDEAIKANLRDPEVPDDES